MSDDQLTWAQILSGNKNEPVSAENSADNDSSPAQAKKPARKRAGHGKRKDSHAERETRAKKQG
jgi:hypothetical protein